MSITRTTDFIYALRIIKLLVTPWDKQEAYKYGIIDKNGNLLRRYKDLKTAEEKDAFTYLHRIVFNLKRLLETIPGGKSWISAATAAYLLLREAFKELNIPKEGWKLIEEAIYNYKLQEETPTNATGAAVATDVPMPLGLVRRKDKQKDKQEEKDKHIEQQDKQNQTK